MTVAEIGELKSRCRGERSRFEGDQEHLSKEALDAAQIAGMEPYLKDNTIFIYTKSDVAKVLKTVANYSKENEKFKVKGGYVSGQVCDQKSIIELSKLPGRMELISMIAGGVNAVIGQFVGVLNAVLTKFVGTIEAVENKKKSE
jgi:large subunit ribosomal protein L10